MLINAQNSPTKRDRYTATSNNSDAIATFNNLQHNSNQQHSNMQILDLVEDGAPTVISPTFEDILSRRLRQTPSIQKSETRRKIDTNSAVITIRDFLDLVAVREQEIEKGATLKAKRIAAKGKKKCVIKNLEETDEPPVKQALLSNTSNEELQVEVEILNNTTLEQAKILLANIHDTIKEQVYFAVNYRVATETVKNFSLTKLTTTFP
ncbi:hypothetical protein AVEN_31904-1 [Araneus ventricosus]|uniref:Uncharacterized protein n=1 Tax=Araneus ventricosus TaxID=182803 RepID=A0A4Y2KIP8_ARAVE|nr:hypothetical protein AVEN_31904-1 [Araneus ventricosus]